MSLGVRRNVAGSFQGSWMQAPGCTLQHPPPPPSLASLLEASLSFSGDELPPQGSSQLSHSL